MEDAFSLVDWTTIFFFTGLFALVYGLEVTGVLEMLGHKALLLVDGSIQKATFLILWSSAVLSAAIDNIPFVATMIPLLKTMEEALGGREAMMPVWWALSVGSCFGGNGSLIAASANVIVAGIAAREGHALSHRPGTCSHRRCPPYHCSAVPLANRCSPHNCSAVPLANRCSPHNCSFVRNFRRSPRLFSPCRIKRTISSPST